jgi:hypothetical protein
MIHLPGEYPASEPEMLVPLAAIEGTVETAQFMADGDGMEVTSSVNNLPVYRSDSREQHLYIGTKGVTIPYSSRK